MSADICLVRAVTERKAIRTLREKRESLRTNRSKKKNAPKGTFVFLAQVKGVVACTLPTPSKPIFLRGFRGFFAVFPSFFILYPNTYRALISYSLPQNWWIEIVYLKVYFTYDETAFKILKFSCVLFSIFFIYCSIKI